MSTSATDTTYFGFYRATKRDPWQRLVESADYSDGWSLLLDAAADRRGGGEILVSRTAPDAGVPAAPQPRRCF